MGAGCLATGNRDAIVSDSEENVTQVAAFAQVSNAPKAPTDVEPTQVSDAQMVAFESGQGRAAVQPEPAAEQPNPIADQVEQPIPIAESGGQTAHSSVGPVTRADPGQGQGQVEVVSEEDLAFALEDVRASQAATQGGQVAMGSHGGQMALGSHGGQMALGSHGGQMALGSHGGQMATGSQAAARMAMGSQAAARMAMGSQAAARMAMASHGQPEVSSISHQDAVGGGQIRQPIGGEVAPDNLHVGGRTSEGYLITHVGAPIEMNHGPAEASAMPAPMEEPSGGQNQPCGGHQNNQMTGPVDPNLVY